MSYLLTRRVSEAVGVIEVLIVTDGVIFCEGFYACAIVSFGTEVRYAALILRSGKVIKSLFSLVFLDLATALGER